jgi:hypothetical protein
MWEVDDNLPLSTLLSVKANLTDSENKNKELPGTCMMDETKDAASPTVNNISRTRKIDTPGCNTSPNGTEKETCQMITHKENSHQIKG